MAIELVRLAVGLLLLIFHRPIADYILERERTLVVLFRQRGVFLPGTLSTAAIRDVYFVLGTFVVLFELFRIWVGLRS